ncbi:MAG: hypothetical protein J4431_02575 [Candidatus Aenigmarchaeota archaeon]|nr:hypothetical protein [Candidatus Aenigmarchaeota archaeon]
MKYVLAAVALIVFINIYLLLYAQGIEPFGMAVRFVADFFGRTDDYGGPLAVVLLGIVLAFATLAMRSRGRK